MKKLLLMMVAVCGLAACNEKLGPQDKTPAVINQPIYNPTAQHGVKVSVSVPVSSLYGLRYAVAYYYLNDDKENVKNVGGKSYDVKKEIHTNYSFDIPGQEPNTKVTFWVEVSTYYYVTSLSNYCDYTVIDGDPAPVPTPQP